MTEEREPTTEELDELIEALNEEDLNDAIIDMMEGQ